MGSGHHSFCKPCKNKYQQAYSAEYRKRPEFAEQSRGWQRKYKYGLAPDEYDELLIEQGGLCAICGAQPENSLHIDHNPETGAVRGLLCGVCNRGLGMYYHDPELLVSAAAYLMEREQSN